MSNRIEITTEDGVCPAFTFGEEGAPNVLMFIDGIGMRPAMHQIAERVAAAGYYVLMPDLFYRAGEYTAPDPAKLFTDPEVRNAWFGKMFAAASQEKAMRDTKSFLEHLPRKEVAVFGYCMGGRLAMVAAATYPDRIVAVGAYHPGNLVTDKPDSPHLQAGAIKARVYIGGASDDATFTDEHKQMVEQALTDAGVEHRIETYPAKHGWVPTDTPVHDPAAAEKHWETLLDLLAHSLH